MSITREYICDWYGRNDEKRRRRGVYELTHTRCIRYIVVCGCTCRLIPSAGQATQATDVVEQPQDEAAHSLCGSLPDFRRISHIVQRIQVHEVGGEGEDSHKHEPQ